MPTVSDIQVLISLLIIAAVILPFYKAYQDRQKEKKAEQNREIDNDKKQADQFHQRHNDALKKHYENKNAIEYLKGHKDGYKDGKAEARAEAKNK